jgi:hypothetical protein
MSIKNVFVHVIIASSWVAIESGKIDRIRLRNMKKNEKMCCLKQCGKLEMFWNFWLLRF